VVTAQDPQRLGPASRPDQRPIPVFHSGCHVETARIAEKQTFDETKLSARGSSINDDLRQRP
jgi:hypothetical protein